MDREPARSAQPPHPESHTMPEHAETFGTTDPVVVATGFLRGTPPRHAPAHRAAGAFARAAIMASFV
jgi:hypothetical protein